MRLADLAEKHVAIWGYGREGRATVSALRRRFPDKLLALICASSEVASVAEMNDHGLFVMEAPVDAATLAGFDIVIKSPGISPYRAPYPEAATAGVHFTSGSALWFAEHTEAKTICVTGTKGKSTVTALIAHILRESGRNIALAGNIGLPLLDLLNPATEPDWWVIELSSFQTRDFAAAPSVAVINNLYEEHLDWHDTRANYVADKLAIAARAQRLVINGAQDELLALKVSGTHLAFNCEDGWHVRDHAIYRGAQPVLSLQAIPLPGLHNAQNVCAALATIEAAGEDALVLAQHVATFKPLPHRLQALGMKNGVDYINDSISTTPYAAIEALRSLNEREVTILVGGFDRGVDWQPFVEFVAVNPPRAIVTMGANGDAIAAKLQRIVDPGFALEPARTFDAAFARAQALTRAGGVILLSPGAPSFDQFRDYAERGREFAYLAGFDPAAISAIEGLGIA